MVLRPGSQKKKLPRWRARICNCHLHEKSHIIRSRKAWRQHQVQLGKLLAGARDAKPIDKQLAHSSSHHSRDSILDINSSVATNPYTAADYQSVDDGDVSQEIGYSSGNLGTTSSSERIRRDGPTPSNPSITTGGTHFNLESTSTSSSETGYNSRSESGLSLGPGLEERLPAANQSVQSQPKSQDCEPLVETQQMTTPETLFLQEVENLIGDPDDWTSSGGESVAGDPFEVGLMKNGLIDEDVLQDDGNPELLDLEQAVGDCGLGGCGSDEDSDMEPIFPYDNENGEFS